MPRAQVHIEAIIAEVSFSTAQELGVEWFLDGSLGTAKTYPIGGTNFAEDGGTLGSIIGDVAEGVVPTFGSGLNLGVGGTTSGGIRFGALLRALASDGSTNILSTPSLTTLDNHEAEIIVGQNVPFRTGSYTTDGGGGQVNPFQTVQREDVGITLKVKPQINEGDAITMTIEQETSSVNEASSSIGDLITNKRSIKTTVMVANDGMIVLGGLIDEDVQESQSRVPLLGSIPWLGRLFRYDKTTKTKRTLLVFIHATIISNPAQGHLISQSKYTYLQDMQNQLNNAQSPAENPEIKPELKEFPEPPIVSDKEQTDPDPESDPDLQSEDKNH
jgi:general secretion pathway protein D